MAIAVSRMKKADISRGKCSPELGRVSLEQARGGELLVSVSKRPHGYRGQQEKRGRYLTRHWPMFARVRQGLIAIRSLRGNE